MIDVLLGATLAWIAILILAILNGVVRETLLAPAMGAAAARAWSGLVLSALVLLVAYVAIPYLGDITAAQARGIGALWTAMTLVFEFAFGLGVQHKPLSELLAAYTFGNGNLWPLVLVMTLVSPWLALHMHASP